MTKQAVIAWQKKNGLPATGYVGPLTIAKLNALAGVTVTPALSLRSSAILASEQKVPTDKKIRR